MSKEKSEEKNDREALPCKQANKKYTCAKINKWINGTVLPRARKGHEQSSDGTHQS